MIKNRPFVLYIINYWSFVSGDFLSHYCNDPEYRNIIQFKMASSYANSPLVFMCSHRGCHFIGALSFETQETLTPGVRKFLY